MVIGQFEYRAPGSLKEGVSLLDGLRTPYAILAGGTDLIVKMKLGLLHPGLIIDVKKIPELNRLEWNEKSGLYIGSAVPLGNLVHYTPLKERFGLLAQTCALIGSTQIRNRATLGGNVCNAAPSADSPPALLCLDAQADIASLKGGRTILFKDFFLGPGETAMYPGEILVGIKIPIPPVSSGGCYLKHTRREGMDIAVAGVASFLILEPEKKTVRDARIALCAVASTPIRARKAEAALIGKPLTHELIQEAAEYSVASTNAINDIRASIGYRTELVKVLAKRSLEKACESLGIRL